MYLTCRQILAFSATASPRPAAFVVRHTTPSAEASAWAADVLSMFISLACVRWIFIASAKLRTASTSASIGFSGALM